MYKLLKRDLARTIKLHADPFKDRHSKGEDYPYWQGTTIGIDMSLDTKEEFTSLLDLIRDTYSQAIKERKKQRYKRAWFI